jgi:hypothetical protein
MSNSAFLNTEAILASVRSDLIDSPQLLARFEAGLLEFSVFVGLYAKQQKLPLDYESFLNHRRWRGKQDIKAGVEPIYDASDWDSQEEHNQDSWLKSLPDTAKEFVLKGLEKEKEKKEQEYKQANRHRDLAKKWIDDGWFWQEWGVLVWPRPLGTFKVFSNDFGEKASYEGSFQFHEKGKASVELRQTKSKDTKAFRGRYYTTPDFDKLSSVVRAAYHYDRDYLANQDQVKKGEAE